MTREEVLARLHSPNFADLCNRHTIGLAVLFGSMAKGGDTPKSDIDLAVSLDKSPERQEGSETASARIALMNDVMGCLQTSRMDLVILNHADSLLRFEIARTGKPVYEAAAGAFADFCSLAVRQHEDSKVFYEAMDRYLARTVERGV